MTKSLRNLAASLLPLASVFLAAQPPSATLSLQTATGQSTFHIGERIPLKLTFNSPDDTTYVIDNYNCGGQRAGKTMSTPS